MNETEADQNKNIFNNIQNRVEDAQTNPFNIYDTVRDRTKAEVLDILIGILNGSEPQLQHIQWIAERVATTRGRDIHDPLLLLLKKFFTGDWRKKIGDQNEAAELLEELSVAIEKNPFQKLLKIILEIAEEIPNLEDKIKKVRKEVAEISHNDTEDKLDERKASINQLLDDLQVAVAREKELTDQIKIDSDIVVEIFQEISDFIYTLAKLVNVEPDKKPSQEKINALLNSCGGISYADAVKICFYKYGSRLLTGKNKELEKSILTDLLSSMNEGEFEFDASEIDLIKVRKLFREMLFEIIGVPERTVVVCDLIMHGTYDGKAVRIVIPRKQNLLDTIGGHDLIVYSNFMTTARVGDTQELISILNKLPKGTIDDDASGFVVNGYLVEKNGEVLRIQGIPRENEDAASILAELQISIEDSEGLNFAADIATEASEGLLSDAAFVSSEVFKISNGRANINAWSNYHRVVRDLLSDRGEGLRPIQMVANFSNILSGRTGQETHSLIIRGELFVPEDVIRDLIDSGFAQYVDTQTEEINMPILILEADRNTGLLAEATNKIDKEKTTISHAIVFGPATAFGRKPAVSANVLI